VNARTVLVLLGALLLGAGLLGGCGTIFLRVASFEPPHPEETFLVDSTVPQTTRPLADSSCEVWVARLGDAEDVRCTLRVVRSDGSLVGESHVGRCLVSGHAKRGEVWTIDAHAPGAEPKSVGAMLGFDSELFPSPFLFVLGGAAAVAVLGVVLLVIAMTRSRTSQAFR
jgi:hypothetical protein